MQLLLHAIATAACPAVLAAACPAVLAAALLACSKWQQHWELAPNCAARYLNFRPTTEEPASGRGERRKTIRDVLPVRPRASATFPCAGGSGLMSRATHCLEGHWVRIAVMAHPHRRMAVVCHLSLAQHGTSCSAVTRASSAGLREVECLAPSHFFHEPSSEDVSQAPAGSEILFRNGNLTLALAGWCRRLWAGSGCEGSGRGPGLVWMGCVVFAAVLLWGGRLLSAGHHSSNAISLCW